MRARKAARLAGRCGAERDGSDGARRALTQLARALARGDHNAAAALSHLWYQAPYRDDVWKQLRRFRAYRLDLPAAVFAAAVEPDRPADARVAIGAFCVRWDLVPEDEIQRALFYVLTGQASRHVADDPDGALLAAAYARADVATRAAVRHALAGSGDLDAVRVVAGSDPPRAISSLTAEEREYLIALLAGRRDWNRLWRLARDLPAAEAVAAIRRFAVGWLPDDTAQHAVFTRLARADPALIAAARDVVCASTIVRIELDEAPTRGCFSPDGRQLLLATERDGGYSGCRVLDLPSGTVAERHDHPGDLPPVRVVHLGRSFLLVGQRRSGVWELIRYAHGRSAVLYWSREPFTVARTETGFAVLATSLASDSWHLPHPSPSGLHVIFCDEGGRMVEQGGDRLAFPADGTAEKGLWLEVDPVGGRLAFGLRGTQFAAWGTADSLRRNLARRVPVPFPALETAWWIAAVMNRAGRGGATAGECFVARDRIAAVDARGRIASYRLEPWTVLIRQRAGARVAGSLPRRDLICLPDRNQIAVIDAKAGVRYLDADSLADAREPGGLGGERGSMLCAAPDGRRVALGGLRGGRGFILLAWDGHPAEAAALARRPLAELTEHDLAVITAAARGSELPHAARPLLNLVRDCLAARLGIAGEPADAEPVTDHAPYQIEDKRPH